MVIEITKHCVVEIQEQYQTVTLLREKKMLPVLSSVLVNRYLKLKMAGRVDLSQGRRKNKFESKPYNPMLTLYYLVLFFSILAFDRSKNGPPVEGQLIFPKQLHHRNN
jgi:hypothetical protein